MCSSDLGFLLIVGKDYASPLPENAAVLELKGNIQNGSPDAVALVKDLAENDGPAQVWDAFTYEGELNNPEALLPWWQGEGSHPGHQASLDSLQRCPNGQDGNDNDGDFMEYAPTPGEMNVCEDVAALSFATDIHPIFAQNCGGCHTAGNSGGHSIGQPDTDLA